MKKGCPMECDWLVFVLLNLYNACLNDISFLIFTFYRWSHGAIMYEMLMGYAPFYSEDPMYEMFMV